MKIDVHIVNAFTDAGVGGNPAGVVLDAGHLTQAMKLAIARAVNLSETAFVSASACASLKLEFFTPAKQIPHCGHATIATFSLCKQLGLLGDGLHSKESIDGILRVKIDGDMTFIYQPPPSLTRLSPQSEIGALALAAIGASEQALVPDANLCIARAGNAFLLIPMQSDPALAALVPNHAAIEQLSTTLDLVGFYPFALATKRPGRSANTRMFAPRYGIPEESATGTAGGPLAYYLAEIFGPQARTYDIEQGWHMTPPSPSLISATIEAHPAEGIAVVVGGKARRMGEKRISA